MLASLLPIENGTEYTRKTTGIDYADTEKRFAGKRRFNEHADGVPSLWSMLRRAHKGTLYQLFSKHLDRHVQETAERYNLREKDAIEAVNPAAPGMNRKSFRYEGMIPDYGLQNGARG